MNNDPKTTPNTPTPTKNPNERSADPANKPHQPGSDQAKPTEASKS